MTFHNNAPQYLFLLLSACSLDFYIMHEGSLIWLCFTGNQHQQGCMTAVKSCVLYFIQRNVVFIYDPSSSMIPIIFVLRIEKYMLNQYMKVREMMHFKHLLSWTGSMKWQFSHFNFVFIALGGYTISRIFISHISP